MNFKFLTCIMTLCFISGVTFNTSAQDMYGTHFRHTVNQANSAGIHTYLDSDELNFNPEAIIIASANLEPNQIPVGDNFTVIYDPDSAKWAIRNADGENAFPIGSTFNVLIPSSGGTWFRVVAPGGNNNFILNNTALNGLSQVKVFITPIYPGYNIGNGNGQFVTEYLPGSVNRWSISSISTIDAGATFNVFVPYQSMHTFVHRVTAPNLTTSITEIDNPLLNGHPEANFIFQRTFSYTNGSSTTYNNRKKSTAYINGKWHIKIDDGNNFFQNDDYSIAILNDLSNDVLSVSDKDESIHLYPNPANNILQVEIEQLNNSSDVGEIQIIDFAGRLIQTYNISGKERFEVDTHDLAHGIYFLKLISNNRQSIKKFVILH